MQDYYLIPICSIIALTGGYGTLAEIQLDNYYPTWRAKGLFLFYAIWAVIAFVWAFAAALLPLAGIITYAVISALMALNYAVKIVRMRTKYKFTRRATRLFLLYAIIEIGVIAALTLPFRTVAAKYAGAAIGAGLSPIAAKVAASLIYPAERAHNRRYVEKTRQYLRTLPVICVGITGSYGKTSCKNVLAEMLSARYKVIKTEGNYNTPLGICKTVEKYNGERVFIAEMGAKRRGDIRELCELVRPKYAVITGVTPQHVESFGSIAEIARTKFELAAAIPQDGFIVFNGDNEYTRGMSEKVSVPYATAGYANGEYHAEKVKLTSQGSKFDLVCEEGRVRVETALLGRHNVLNIVMCAALAHRLGITLGEIAEAAGRLKPVAHRLEAREAGGITIIDDSYNSNIEGVGYALEVLSAFSGRKVVYTQGLVELGKLKKSMNRDVGRQVAAVADVAILSGVNADYIESGLVESGFAGKIHKFKSLKEAEKGFPDILKSGDVLLIQNDIP